MKLEFTLRPLDEIEPWGEATDRSLHWFALTDGFFRFVIARVSLFDYDGTLKKDSAGKPEGCLLSMRTALATSSLGRTKTLRSSAERARSACAR